MLSWRARSSAASISGAIFASRALYAARDTSRSPAVERPELITEVADAFGSQCAVANVDAARLDGGDPDAEVPDLLAKRFGYPLERELAAVIIAKPRQRDDAAHRRDVDDVSGASLAHGRQHRLHHGHRADYVDLELTSQVAGRAARSAVPVR